MNCKLKYILIVAATVLLAACGKPKAELPAQYSQLEERADIYPDYTDIVVPPNIAPLNFIVRDTLADAFVAHLRGKDAELMVSAGKDGVMQMDMAEVLLNLKIIIQMNQINFFH